MWDIELGLVHPIAIYIDSPLDCLGMMTIKEKMFNGFVTAIKNNTFDCLLGCPSLDLPPIGDIKEKS